MRKQQGPGFFVRAIRLIVMAVIFGAIAGGTMIGMGYGYRYFNDNSDKQISKTDTTASINTIEKQTEESDSDKKSSDTTKENADTTKSSGITITDVSDIVDEVMPSVVAITSTEIIKSAGNDLWSYFYGNGSGGNDQYETQGAGSGIIVGENDAELLIVTNQHVVADADSLSVQFCNEKSVEATVRGENEKQDIAVLSIPLSDIDSDTISAIKIATLGDSDKVKVGEGSIAIGNALGYGQSVTTGVISALNRTITVDNYDRTVLQTDAAINPGNSGGALLNMKGEVIGINCAKSTQNYSEGMGYTIPISLVKDLIDDMMTKDVKQKVDDNEKGYLNIYGKDVTSDLSQMYDIPEGVYIMDVIKDGAAEKAGLSKYDVITAVEGESISSMEELQEQLGYYKKGEKVKLTIETLEKNEYVEKEVEIELGDEME
ncbi:S1C family serine protease [Lachnospiraceae bacterium HCP1S3_B3]